MSELRNPLFGNWSFWTLEILFFFAYSAENAEYPRRDAPAYAGELNKLLSLDLLERREGNTFVTERGWAMLNYIKSAPLPPTTEQLYMEWLDRQGAAK